MLVDTVTFALSVPVFGHGPSRPARASREIMGEHGLVMAISGLPMNQCTSRR
jgi:hypothetical protein